jgi:hypothetical protein
LTLLIIHNVNKAEDSLKTFKDDIVKEMNIISDSEEIISELEKFEINECNRKRINKLEKELEEVKEYKNNKNKILLDLYEAGKHNKKIIGKFKDELCGKPLSELSFLRSKQYAYIVNDEDYLKCKGVGRAAGHFHRDTRK